jgi:hypothetical protein
MAIAADEPLGRQLTECRRVPVDLELIAEEDTDALEREGMGAMRQRRVARLARQARIQGGLLAVEDLAHLTCTSPTTVKRDLAELRRRGVAVATRAHLPPTGAAVPNRVQAVRLYLADVALPEIEHHTGGAVPVRDALAEFAQVATLFAQGMSVSAIPESAAIGSDLASDYLAVYERTRRRHPPPCRLAELVDPEVARNDPQH